MNVYRCKIHSLFAYFVTDKQIDSARLSRHFEMDLHITGPRVPNNFKINLFIIILLKFSPSYTRINIPFWRSTRFKRISIKSNGVRFKYGVADKCYFYIYLKTNIKLRDTKSLDIYL